jgi:sporulation protein YlmC with PRC-barrel domain
MMTNFRSLTAALALSAALAVPAFAQTTNGTAANGASSHATTTNGAMTGSAATAPTASDSAAMGNTGGKAEYTTAGNDVRASKVIGAAVYNDNNQKIGTIDDLLMNGSHDVTQAVLSVGGFLGLDSKLVAVNIDKLQVRPNRIVMAGATKDGLTKMPTYKFNNSAS